MRSFGFAPPIGFSGDDAAGAQASASTWARGAVVSLRDRLVPPMPPASIWGWAGPLLVTLFGGFLRFYRLSTPHAIVFDETYYVPDAYGILKHGVELNAVASAKNRDVVDHLLAHGSTHILTNTGEYVVHPPLGKAMIAVGEWLFGLTPFGWRIVVAVLGTASILMISRITRRMTRSTMLGCIAGLLMSLDGLELVLSRTAVLDIIVMFWILAAFGMLVLDRDAMRARLADAAIADGEDGAGVAGVDLAGGGPNLGIRWRRVLAGLFLGLACASKWNGVWFLFAFAIMAIAWDLGARRAAGYQDRLAGVLRSDGLWLPLTFGVIPFAAYTASWSGWFAGHLGYDRNWAALVGNHTPIWSTLDSWYQYQKSMLGFGLGLSSHAGYTSEPWGWLTLARPVSFFYEAPKGCGASSCSQEVLAIGTPAIWWASIAAILFCLVWWISRRDWRAGTVLVGVAAGWLPWWWFAWHDNRTEYYFYSVAFLPFLVIAITLCLGLIIGPTGATPGRRAVGAVIVGAYLLLVLANFAFMYPVFTAEVLPYDFWRQRMWFSSWI
ncbi:MAG TPA: phospholipid carrier-dependent glycosyltransferase [Streptosporangiaceae bacterium]|jgi:dolichyl-phosphate-mannose-protein mannosyltransferase|nr:phospholipid carrier-dependent glycosyltransferase [Streptosporangiaceae bacterium]